MNKDWFVKLLPRIFEGKMGLYSFLAKFIHFWQTYQIDEIDKPLGFKSCKLKYSKRYIRYNIVWL